MGYLRFALALIVMRVHIGPVVPGYSAALAVLGFYALAGYTSTASMQTRYKGNAQRFLVSRWLRLWPSYAAVFLLSLGWLLAGNQWGAMAVPIALEMPSQWLMIVRGGGVDAVIPPAWMVQYLLLGYLAIALGISATPRRCALWLATSLIWSHWWAFRLDFRWYYGTIGCVSLAFAVGAACYHLGLKLPRDKGLGALLGGLSYPMFLSHYLVGAVISTSLGVYGWPLLCLALPPTLALSWLLHRFIEKPVGRVRRES